MIGSCSLPADTKLVEMDENLLAKDTIEIGLIVVPLANVRVRHRRAEVAHNCRWKHRLLQIQLCHKWLVACHHTERLTDLISRCTILCHSDHKCNELVEAIGH